MKNEKFACPCCGFPGLDVRPYKYMPDPPYPRNVAPPYAAHWGEGSYGVCSCCGYEFGFDDEPGAGVNGPLTPTTFDEFLRDWIETESCKWFEPELKPDDWDLTAQLKSAGIPVPAKYFKPV